MNFWTHFFLATIALTFALIVAYVVDWRWMYSQVRTKLFWLAVQIRAGEDVPAVRHGMWVGGLVATLVLSYYILAPGFDHRYTPWWFLGFWTAVIWVGYGTFVLCLFFQMARESVGSWLGHWLSRVWRVGSHDNTSANTLLALLPVMIFLCISYSVPNIGPDPAEVAYQADQAVGKVWESEPAKPLHQLWGFITKGEKLPVVERAMGRKAPELDQVASWSEARPWNMEKPLPVYQRKLWPELWIVTAIVALLLLFDFPMSRRDEFKALFKLRKERKEGVAQSSGGEKSAAPVSAVGSPQNAEAGNAGAAAENAAEVKKVGGGLMRFVDELFEKVGPFLSDLLAAFTVAEISNRRVGRH